MVDQFSIVPGIWLLNAVAGVASIWFFSNLGRIFEDFDWYSPRLGLLWFIQIVIIGASVLTFIMVEWSLGIRSLGLWFVLLCPPLIILFLGLVVSTVVISLWIAVFAAASAWSRTRVFAPTLATVVAVLVGPPVLDNHWDAEMCHSAEKLGLTDIQRPPFLTNVARIGTKSPREPYAIAFDGEAYWDWSYDRMHFVPFQKEFPHRSDTSEFTPLNCD